jgi:hypothetical protein
VSAAACSQIMYKRACIGSNPLPARLFCRPSRSLSRLLPKLNLWADQVELLSKSRGPVALRSTIRWGHSRTRHKESALTGLDRPPAQMPGAHFQTPLYPVLWAVLCKTPLLKTAIFHLPNPLEYHALQSSSLSTWLCSAIAKSMEAISTENAC